MIKPTSFLGAAFVACVTLVIASPASAQIGRRFPSEKKIVVDPVTGVPLTFLTTKPGGDSKIYQTHHQWTADGKWLIFRSNRVRGQAMAVNEETGDIVQITENGFSGMLCIADHSMSLYFLRSMGAPPSAAPATPPPPGGAEGNSAGAGAAGGGAGRGRGPSGPSQIIKLDLAKLFADSEAGKMQAASVYEKVCGTIPIEMGAGGDMALDASEEFAFFRVGREEAAKHLPADTKMEPAFGPRGMGAGPTGLASMNLKTGEVSYIVSVPFQIGHVQTNPWVPGEIVFCWETGGKAPQRTWTVRSDGTGLRPLYPEAPYEWITHEAVITKDEVAIAILAHRPIGGAAGTGPGEQAEWGPSGTAEHPTGVGIVNLRTREMRIVGQTPFGDAGRSNWHVNGSPDGRWAVFDDFQYRLWIIDRRNGQTALLADLGHKNNPPARDHIHPTFNADSTKIEIQTAMLAADNRELNICIVPVPESWLKRTYGEKIQ